MITNFSSQIPPGQKGLVIGCPVPYEYFETKGKGESDLQIHAGSYHIALQEARIERANIMVYSSILPAIAKRITIEEGVKRIQHGAEMKVIQAAAHADTTKGQKRATAAIMYGHLYKNGEFSGGLVCEYNDHGTVEEAKENLTACLDGLYKNPNPDGKSFADEYELKDIKFISETIEPTKRFGTALVALAFVNYFVPVLAHNVLKEKEAMEVAQTIRV